MRFNCIFLSFLLLLMFGCSTPPTKSSTTESKIVSQKPLIPDTSKMEITSIEVYSTSWCPACHYLKSQLNLYGVPFTEYDVEKDTKAAKELGKFNPERSVPVTVINKGKEDQRVFVGVTKELSQTLINSQESIKRLKSTQKK